MDNSSAAGFLSVPPFPRSRPAALSQRAPAQSQTAEEDLDGLIGRIRELQVGGTYWAPQPQLQDRRFVLVRVRDAAERDRILAQSESTTVVWVDSSWQASPRSRSVGQITGPCDPWHVLRGAAEYVTDRDDEVALVAAILEVPLRFGDKKAIAGPEFLRERLRTAAALPHSNPFTGERMEFGAAIELCGFWRALIDSNRDIGAAFGFASWKRATVAPLLWGGQSVPFASAVATLTPGKRVVAWKSRTKSAVLRKLEASSAPVTEVEDGFIRSVGLGANCVPPLSIVVDRRGIYFDPRRPSDLEKILQDGEFSSDLLQRARALRQLIVEFGISKYGVGGPTLQRRREGKRHLLVVGQVDDDRAVSEGGGPRNSLELLRRVRESNPEAYVTYKPHPDVEAGHRPGSVPGEVALSVASEVVADVPMSSLIDVIDEVHVNTSLAGFEALLRGKPVTTYGVPFYAGWGLTRDLGPVPQRRTAHRTIDELVAATLLLYPRYVDPVTGLPCPPEILIRRLAEGATPADGVLVRLRRLQGHFKRGIGAVTAF
jgi:capsular polysaccharide export protein